MPTRRVIVTALLLHGMISTSIAGLASLEESTAFATNDCYRCQKTVSEVDGVMASQGIGINRRVGATVSHPTTTAIMMSSENSRENFNGLAEIPLPLPHGLRNRYFLLRHGQSYGNVEGVISSARALANSEKHGLTPLGWEQGAKSANELLDLLSIGGILPSSSKEKNDTDDKQRQEVKQMGKVYFYSSPFARARQTARACLDGLLLASNGDDGASKEALEIHGEIIMEDGLMERYFGALDDTDVINYDLVWPLDMNNITNTGNDVESVAAVTSRLHDTLIRIDNNPIHDNAANDIVVLVSHADILQILQVYAAGVENIGTFSSYRFANGEVRAMGRTLDTLPEPSPMKLQKSSFP